MSDAEERVDNGKGKDGYDDDGHEADEKARFDHLRDGDVAGAENDGIRGCGRGHHECT